jgi:hypothetical protein
MRIDLVLVRLGAIFIIVYALQNLANYMTFIMGGGDYMLVAVFEFFLVFAVPALISWTLWRFPRSVVGSLYSGDEKAQENSEHSGRALLIGLSLLGVYTLVFGIIDLVYFEAHRFAEYRLTDYADYFDYPILPQTIAGRTTNIVQIVFGIALIYGRNGIATFLRQIRTAGVKTR